MPPLREYVRRYALELHEKPTAVKQFTTVMMKLWISRGVFTVFRRPPEMDEK
jgi:hypothetical protein